MQIYIQPQPLCYEITIQAGALTQLDRFLSLNRKMLIVTGDGVPEQYSATVAKQCKTPVVVRVPDGEQHKSMAQYERLLQIMVEHNFSREDAVIAVGGGVVGDLAGFVASTYMRGIDFYNIPTTLLAQVDSSIGGKTAINFQGIKNIVGAFYQPKQVIIDPDTLKTLEPRLIHAGLAESVKMALTCDAALFETIENSTCLEADLPKIIERSLEIKAWVVEQDPQEKGLRKILNFGHTIGHAIEADAKGSLLHGECVALGMIPMCSPTVRNRLLPVLKKYELPTSFSGSAQTLLPYLLHDKKRQETGISAIFVDTVGSYCVQTISPQQVARYLEVFA